MTFEYSSDIELVPRHLGVEFFEEILEDAIRQSNVKAKKVKFEMGSNTGENYCSQIYRTLIDYNLHDKIQQLSVIIKSLPKSQATEFLEDLEVFLKEKIFYKNLLPLMEICLDAGEKFGARLYHSIKYPINTLAFEDLKTCGYRMANRESGLDEAHCQLVLKKLGQFHGISMVLAKKDPELLKSFNGGILAKAGLYREGGMLMHYFGSNAGALVDLISSWDNYEEITKKVTKYKNNLRENLIRTTAPIADELKVLNHGDLWVNNILFKYEHDNQQRLKDVVFVDYQMAIWGSPGFDLNYFLNTSLQLNILQTKREVLIEKYHDSLQATLRKLQYTSIPTLQDIMREVQQRESFGFFANYGIFPTVSMDKEISSDNTLENFLDENFAKNKVRQMFASKRLEENLKYTLRRFNDLSIWD